jgi:serine/threonine-protein kinase RsbW/stage II sporulation protein AB (anti-sigma F factor)
MSRASRGASHPLRRTVPAVPACVAGLRADAAGYLAAAGAPPELTEAVRLAVSEAVSNVILHAYPPDDDPGPVHLVVEVSRGTVHVTVADEGRGMAPRFDSPGAGLGLPIIANVATRLELGPAGEAGTELRMSFDGLAA